MDELEVQELLFGLDNGTEFYQETGHVTRTLKVNLATEGLPPNKGDLVKFVVLVDTDQSQLSIKARQFWDEASLFEILYNDENFRDLAERADAT